MEKFFNELQEDSSHICFDTKKYRGLNHVILRLRVFFLFVLVLVVFGINLMLSLKPLFLSASEYIGIDSLKTTSPEEISEIRLAIALGISL